MTKCPWEIINDFRSLLEFNRFVQWMNEQVNANVAREIAVRSPYASSTSLNEKWFFHIDSGEAWRLIWPDPPFTGIFEPVRLISDTAPGHIAATSRP